MEESYQDGWFEKIFIIFLIVVVLAIGIAAFSHGNYDPKPDADKIQQLQEPRPYDIKKVDK